MIANDMIADRVAELTATLEIDLEQIQLQLAELKNCDLDDLENSTDSELLEKISKCFSGINILYMLDTIQFDESCNKRIEELRNEYEL